MLCRLISVAGGPRTYDDPCGIARALDAIGERWAVLVVRELMFGPKRFNQLRRGLPGPSPNVLSQRLRELEQVGIVRRYELEPPAGVAVYELTERGRQLEPVLLELGRWGSREPLESTQELSPDALLLAMKTTFSARAARDLDAEWELILDGDVYRIRVVSGTIDIGRGRASDAVARLDTDAATLRSLAFGGAELATAIRAGDIAITGTRRSVVRLLGLFHRPTAA
jgi:DNA-binding HxlR family transcriptional regulator